MSVDTADRDPRHLFPAFADLVQRAVAEATRESVGKFAHFSHWIILEGFRSQARQDWLYAQGRTRPGDIVTHRRVSFHTSGLSADCVPVDVHGAVMWEAPDALWAVLRHCAHLEGLESGQDWSSFIDKPHLQPTGPVITRWTPDAHAYLRGLHLI